MEKSFYSIFKTFFKVGTLLLGGGYVILPLLTSELVDKKHWISTEELCEYYAISTSLPGIIAANTSIFTGKKLLGTKGAIAAITGVTMPAFIAIVLLASFLGGIAHYEPVKNIFWGIGIGVIALLFFAVKEMWRSCVNDKFSTIVFIICLTLALFTKISPAIIVIIAFIIGVSAQFINDRQRSRDE